MDLAIRQAAAGDALPCAEMSARLLGGDVAGWSHAILADIVGDDCAVFVAEVRDRLIGHARIARQEPAGPKAPANAAPNGLYLVGLLVEPRWRRRGVGEALTGARLAWAWHGAPVVYYFANARNQPSIDLHAGLGFREVTRDFFFPGATYAGGVGILFRADRPAADAGRPASTAGRAPDPV